MTTHHPPTTVLSWSIDVQERYLLALYATLDAQAALCAAAVEWSIAPHEQAGRLAAAVECYRLPAHRLDPGGRGSWIRQQWKERKEHEPT